MVSMDFDAWVKQFQPVVQDEAKTGIDRYLVEDAPDAPSVRVWSLVEGDGLDGIIEGADDHAMAYLVSTVPAEQGVSYTIDYPYPEADWDDVDPDLLF